VAPSVDRAARDAGDPLHAPASQRRLDANAQATRVGGAGVGMVSPAVVEQLHRARRAAAFVHDGRHAAAERLLREVAAALARRQARDPCAQVLIDLGRLLLVRGRAADAQRAFVEAAGVATESHSVRVEAVLWQVAAATDLARPDEASGLLRGIEGARGLEAWHLAWADACVVRLALWRADGAATAASVPSCPCADPIVAAWIDSVAVRGLLAAGELFDAGRRVAEARARLGCATSAHARVLVERARLRVICESGDVEAAAACLAGVREAAREARTPLEAARAVLIWAALLRRIGRHREAEAAARRLQRTAAVAPPLLRLAIERESRTAAAPASITGVLRRAPVHPAPSRVAEIAGPSAALDDLRRSIERTAAAPFSVLIEGESGVGKELVARALHRLSPRGARRFCDLNCAALPDDLVEAELFGHARGAFTGAPGDRPGLFEEASGGTLFLDEVSELSARAQAKLLRVLQQHEVRRLGEAQTRPVDVRVVAAANRSMADEVSAGRFRADLLYRLDVVRLRVPPLRERPEDVPVLAALFWQSSAARVGSTAVLGDALLRALAAYPWPGNVRELQNVMAALAVAAPARGRVPPSLLPSRIRDAHVPRPTLADVRTVCERDTVRAALGRAGGCRAEAARELGLTRQGLLKTMRRLGLSRPLTSEAPGR
jgi:DNA-binding NtrC family response regulator